MKRTRSQKEYQKFLIGKKIARREAILTKCYDCCAGYADGTDVYTVESCPLHQFYPYWKAEPSPEVFT